MRMSKAMKRLLPIFLLLPLIISLCACTSEKQSPEKIVEDFFAQLYNVAEEDAASFQSVSPNDLDKLETELSKLFSGYFTQACYARFLGNRDWDVLLAVAAKGGEAQLRDLLVSPLNSDESGEAFQAKGTVVYTSGTVDTPMDLQAELRVISEDGMLKIDSLFFREKPELSPN